MTVKILKEINHSGLSFSKNTVMDVTRELGKKWIAEGSAKDINKGSINAVATFFNKKKKKVGMDGPRVKGNVKTNKV